VDTSTRDTGAELDEARQVWCDPVMNDSSGEQPFISGLPSPARDRGRAALAGDGFPITYQLPELHPSPKNTFPCLVLPFRKSISFNLEVRAMSRISFVRQFSALALTLLGRLQ
jgi:hypothetical protein